MLATKPSKPLSKRSSSHEERDTPTGCVPQPPTEHGRDVSSRLPKQSDNIKLPKGSPDPSASVSKLPTRGQRSSSKEKPRKQTSAETSVSTPTCKREVSNTETADAASERGTADEGKEEAGGDALTVTSLSPKEQQPVIKRTDNASSTGEGKLKGKATKELQESITSPAAEGIKRVRPTQNNNAIIPVNVSPVTEVAEESPSQLPLTGVKDSKAGFQLKIKQPTKVECTEKEDIETSIAPKICQEEVKEKDILGTTKLTSNRKADLIQERGGVTDASPKPVPVETPHSDIISSSDQEGFSLKETKKVPSEEYNSSNSVPAKDQDAEPTDITSISVSVESNLAVDVEHQKGLLEDQTTNIILKNDLVADFEGKEEVGRKAAQTVTVCEFPKNVEHQLDKESLSLTGEFESADSQDSCKKEPEGKPIEDEAERVTTKTCKRTGPSSGDKCLQSDSGEGPQSEGVEALEEKEAEAEQARSALHDHTNTDSVVDTEQEAHIIRENAKSGDKEPHQHLKTQTGKKTLEAKVLPAKEEAVKYEEATHSPEPKAVRTKTTTPKEERKTEEMLMENLPIETVDSEVRSHKKQKTGIAREQDENITNREAVESVNSSTESKEEAPEQETERPILQMDPEAQSSETQRAECAKEETETKDVSVETGITSAGSEVSSQQEPMSIIVGDQHEEINKQDRSRSTKSKDANTDIKRAPDGAEAPEKISQSQIEELKFVSTKTPSAEGTKEEREPEDSPLKASVSETAIMNSDSDVSTQQNLMCRPGRDQDENIKNKLPDTKLPNCNLEQAPETVRTEDLKADTTEEAPPMSTEGERKAETKDPSKRRLGNERAAAGARFEDSNQQDQKSVIASTKTESADGAQDQTETKHPSVNETAVRTGSQIQELQDPSPLKRLADERVQKDPKRSIKDVPVETDQSTFNANPVVFTTGKAAGKADEKQKNIKEMKEGADAQNKLTKQEDQGAESKKESFSKDALISKGVGEEKTPVVPDEALNCTDARNNAHVTKEKAQTGSTPIQGERTMNLSDPQKHAKPTPDGNLSLCATAGQPAASKRLQPIKESPSSWLDVEHQRHKKGHRRKDLKASASEDESLEPDDIDDFIRSVKEGSVPFSLPPKRHIPKKSLSPPFAMPAIKEDNFEKTFDPEEFQFGLRKNAKGFRDPSPAMMIKQKAANRKGRTLEKRAQDNAPDDRTSLGELEGQQETSPEAGKEGEHNRGEPGKLTSRLERMSILSSLLNSPRCSRTTKEEVAPSPLSPQQQGSLAPGKQEVVESPGPASNAAMDQGPPVGGGIGTISESALKPSPPPPPPPSPLPLPEAKLPDHLDAFSQEESVSETSLGSTLMTKTKLDPDGTVMDQASILGVSNVNVGLKGPSGPPLVRSSQQGSGNGRTTSKTKVGLSGSQTSPNSFIMFVLFCTKYH